jgi:hypothetical protein
LYALGTKMNCPKCGARIHLDKQSVEISNASNAVKWGGIPEDFYRCWGCGFLRPLLWWLTLELEINTEIKLLEPEKKEELPEEFSGQQEMSWGD